MSEARLTAGADIDAMPGGLRAGIEAVLMVTDEPVTVDRFARVFGVSAPEVADALAEIAASLTGRGYELREVGGGWRFYSRRDLGDYVSQFVMDGQTARLTQAALETLAVVAYRQPVSRGKIAAIRGVNVDSVMRTLAARSLVEEAGTDPESQAVLYQTTSYFLERLGLDSISELPQLSPHLPGIDELDALDADL
ncbi:SMC-Scp complex subunit ScpB [Zhihengliuella flava]|uniref:Segregation and condensation protein B n=1 Tax=Zhihengliuella flava TaxID=1285193 RepID=A0A931D7X3_9MICC|nr:SMC-Scp complex subunit ScpB [Zhihengliuella flava]MBG6083712.1 segregation and condensation protein B [Zhihengliuella flava]